MANYHINSTACCKILLHCTKYQSAAVNGLLLGTVDKSNHVHVHDAIPLFHHHTLTPMLEFAVAVISEYCADHTTTNIKIVGLYSANANYDDEAINPLVRKIAEKLQLKSALKGFSLLQVLNAQMGSKTAIPFKLLAPVSKSSSGTIQPLALNNWGDTRAKFIQCLRKDLHNRLADFDDHLEDAKADWRNLDVRVADVPVQAGAESLTSAGEKTVHDVD